ncbi:hypothetical protein ACFWOT_09190 [Streptomyces sp. NPDC058440]|uniref:hypothetical protein n=1 Tax=Streptomyces sp. NPDC058440 TaxID=3346501 RepID=UPI00366A3643
MLQFFGIDLLDLWRGRLSLRRISVLIGALMRQTGRSALAAVLDEAAEWSESEYLLARVSDALELSNFLFIKANSGEEAQDIPVPDPLPRPGQIEPEPEPVSYTHASTDEVVDFFTRMNSL